MSINNLAFFASNLNEMIARAQATGHHLTTGSGWVEDSAIFDTHARKITSCYPNMYFSILRGPHNVMVGARKISN